MQLAELRRGRVRNPVPTDQLRANIRYARGLGLPALADLPAHDGVLAIVAGGPSARQFVTDLRGRSPICAAGSVHDWLIGEGVIPTIAMVLDPLPAMARFFTRPHPDVVYFVATTCDRAVFDALRGHQVVAYDAAVYDGQIDEHPGHAHLGGGSTVGLRAINLGLSLGFRAFDLFGFDSCLVDGETHAYPAGASGDRLDVVLNGRRFTTTPQLAIQALDFQELAAKFGHLFSAAAYGDGLIAEMLHPSDPEPAPCTTA